MRNPRFIRTLAVILAGVVALSISACHRYRTATERADRLVNKITKELDLNEQQQAKLAAVREAFLSARSQARPEHEAMFNDALAVVQSDQLDQAKLVQLLDRHHAAQKLQAAAVIPKLAEFHASLRPDQRAKAAEELKRFRERMHGHD
jgi:protein CpxP